jgi:hypothetical protein
MDFVLAPTGTLAISAVHMHIQIRERFFSFSHFLLRYVLARNYYKL